MPIEWGYPIIFGLVDFPDEESASAWREGAIEEGDLDDFGALFFDIHEQIGAPVSGVVAEIGKCGRSRSTATRVEFVIHDDGGDGDRFGRRACMVIGAAAVAARLGGSAEVWCVGEEDPEKDVSLQVTAGDLAAPGPADCAAAIESAAYRAIRDGLGFTEEENIILGVFDD